MRQVAIKKENERLVQEADALRQSKQRSATAAASRQANYAAGVGVGFRPVSGRVASHLRETVRAQSPAGAGGLDLEAARRQELLKSEELIARFRKVLETERRNIREVPRSLHASLPSSLPARPGTHEAFDTHPRTQLLSWGVIVCATIRFSSSLVVRPASDSFSVTVKLHPRVASRRTSQDV